MTLGENVGIAKWFKHFALIHLLCLLVFISYIYMLVPPRLCLTRISRLILETRSKGVSSVGIFISRRDKTQGKHCYAPGQPARAGTLQRPDQFRTEPEQPSAAGSLKFRVKLGQPRPSPVSLTGVPQTQNHHEKRKIRP